MFVITNNMLMRASIISQAKFGISSGAQQNDVNARVILQRTCHSAMRMRLKP